MTTLKVGLIQMALKADTAEPPEAIRERMLEAHLPLIDEAGRAGVQVLCFQEISPSPTSAPARTPSGTGPRRRCPTARPPG